MTASLIFGIVSTIATAWGLNPVDVDLTGDSTGVRFTLQGVGGSCLCWATANALIVGGRGEMAGGLTTALVAVCAGIATPK